MATWHKQSDKESLKRLFFSNMAAPIDLMRKDEMCSSTNFVTFEGNFLGALLVYPQIFQESLGVDC